MQYASQNKKQDMMKHKLNTYMICKIDKLWIENYE